MEEADTQSQQPILELYEDRRYSDDFPYTPRNV